MLVSRLLEGVGFAICAVAGAVVSTTSATPTDRPIAVALWATWIPVGQVVCSLVAIPVVSFGQWKPLWWASILVTLGAWGWGRALHARGCVALAPPVPVVVAAAPVGTASPSAKKSLYDERRGLVWVAAVLFGVWSGQYLSYVTWLPPYVVETFGVDAGMAARLYLIPCVVGILLSLCTAALLRAQVDLALLLGSSMALQAVAWWLIPVAQGPFLGTFSLVLYGASVGVTAAALFSVPSALLGHEAPRGFAALMAGRNVGVLVGPVLLAQTVTWSGGWGWVAPLFGGSCLACSLTAVALCHRLSLLNRRKG
jgi:hypothetical protein